MPVEWPRQSWQRTLSALYRRLDGSAAFNRLHLSRVRRLREKWGANHLLYPWILGEPVPDDDKISRTILVLDRNWTRFPENFVRTPGELDSLLENWMRVANHVVAISQDVARDLSARWPVLAHKIVVIPLAGPSPVLSFDDFHTKEPCFYYPATVSAHKGHTVLLEAARLLREQGHRFRLVLSGHGTEVLVESVNAQHKSLFTTGFVQPLGYADAAEVRSSYLRASAVVLPSFYEGFGLPLAEAIAHGTPVICTDLPSYREQIDRLEAGRYVQIVPVGDAESLAGAMAARIALGSPAAAERVSISRAAERWTWRDVAEAYLKILCGTTP
jgi:glycosyltransferase involved in cell wall biosynthesis